MQLKKLAAAALRGARKACGFALVLSALAAPALAIPGGPVPEIDAASLASAVTMLGFGAMLLADRIRRK